MRCIAMAITGDSEVAEKVVLWAYEGQESPASRKMSEQDKAKMAERKKENAERTAAVDRIYSLYPSSVIRADGNRASLKSRKDKEKISRILGWMPEEKLSGAISRYIAENHGAYTKMLSTFLNNIPDYEEDLHGGALFVNEQTGEEIDHPIKTYSISEIRGWYPKEPGESEAEFNERIAYICKVQEREGIHIIYDEK